VAAASDVARLLAPELGWSGAEQAAQVDSYRAEAESERLASTGGN